MSVEQSTIVFEDGTAVEYRDSTVYAGVRVGTDGSIWSRWTFGSRGGRGGRLPASLGDVWKRSKQSYEKSTGYSAVAFGGRKVRAHVVVLSAFAGPRPEGAVCRHLDGNKQNNRPDNLAWGTPTENMHDKDHHGTHNKGDRNGRRKVTSDIVLQVRSRHAALKAGRLRLPRGALTALCREFGLSQQAVMDIANRKTWAHV